jgi:hypothetical protein
MQTSAGSTLESVCVRISACFYFRERTSERERPLREIEKETTERERGREGGGERESERAREREERGKSSYFVIRRQVKLASFRNFAFKGGPQIHESEWEREGGDVLY